MSKTAVLVYAVVGAGLIAWAVMSGDALPLGLLLLACLAALLHLVGPGKMGKAGADQQLREQARARYGVHAPDRPRF
ncbi:hypothetical protein [Ornithinimicrobium pekingense]|uniref:DUF4229 domain-containing protein n=1 Tax=Ornithinimicrobium pekingense TaxID=384677 RepID=A0ABQ2F985_9MICO|nr:hypothetical protein [Ornithinimicrobium pekingense]GGK71979.1 hypothetical protein GCM10011509_20750 [Ornithinimicrobium pekingense]